LDEVKNDMSYNALEESHSKLAKKYVIQSGISELKPWSLVRSVAYGESEVKLKACKTIINRW